MAGRPVVVQQGHHVTQALLDQTQRMAGRHQRGFPRVVAMDHRIAQRFALDQEPHAGKTGFKLLG